MQLEGKSPLLILGTPLGTWGTLAESVRKASHLPRWDVYEHWNRELLGAGLTEMEIGAARTESPKLEIPHHLKDQVAELARNAGVTSGTTGISVYGCWTSDYWLKALPSATGLVFYEHPARMLSRTLTSDATASVAMLRAIWCASAQNMLASVRRHRTRSYLLNVHECLKFQEAFQRWSQKHLGLSPDLQSVPPMQEEEDGILHALAEKFCLEDTVITSLFLELEASAHPVSEEWDSTRAGAIEQAAAVTLDEWLALRRKSGEMTVKDREREGRITELGASLEARQAELKSMERKIAAAEATKLAAVNEALEPMRRKESDAAGAYELLLVELHRAFQESEDHFEKWKKAESSGGELSLQVGSVNRGDMSERTEHRHVNYTFQNVELFGRRWPSLRVRLVEHGGDAGFLIFAPGAPGTPPLHHWKPAGDENGFVFMLFVPKNAGARNALIGAPASDLILIRDSVALIGADLRRWRPIRPGRVLWSRVADRLLQEIDELRERLHYDSVRTEVPTPSDSEPPFFFEVVNACFRGRVFSSLKFSWGPSLVAERFVLSVTDPAQVPLSFWPQTQDGRLTGTIDIPASWGHFTRGDKALVRAIRAEVPNFLVHAADQHPARASEIRGVRSRILLTDALGLGGKL